MEDKTTTPAQGAPNPSDPPAVEPVLSGEAQQVADAVMLGIKYTESFTLREACESFNKTRIDIDQPDGTVYTAAEQRFNLPDSWFAKREGSFELRSPGFYDDIEMRVRYNQLTQAVPVDDQTSAIINATVVSEKLLAKKPEWFNLAAFKPADQPALVLIAHWYSQWRRTFRDEG